jgi:hypothetical protein
MVLLLYVELGPKYCSLGAPAASRRDPKPSGSAECDVGGLQAPLHVLVALETGVISALSVRINCGVT